MGKKKFRLFGTEFNKKWEGFTATAIVVGSLITVGYSAGNYLSEITCERQMLKITEEYQDKIFEHRQSCDLSRLTDLEKKQEDLEMTIQKIKKVKNEK